MVVKNFYVYGLAESIFRSGYAMLKSAPDESEFLSEVNTIKKCIVDNDLDNRHIQRAIKLAHSKTGGHDQYLTGIIVQGDFTFTNKVWVEAERYRFFYFITSMSTMHRMGSFDLDAHFNEHVDERVKEIMYELLEEYNKNPEDKDAFLRLVHTNPAGFKLMSSMTTNYRCLKNMYRQRTNHKLKDWKEFCEWVEGLPLAKQLIL